MAKTLYKLTDGDRQIFRRASELRDPSIITNYYLRRPDSGTYWRPVSQSDIDSLSMDESKAAALRWLKGYETLYAIWKGIGKPDFFGPDTNNPTKWIAYNEENYLKMADRLERVYRVTSDLDSTDPVFHHPHGLIFLPWTTKMHQGRTPIQAVVGGYGSAKTYGKAMSFLVRGITLPGYRAFAIAPFSLQANEVHNLIMGMVSGTRFEQFLLGSPSKPFPKIILGNDVVGQTTIECYPGDDPKKFLTLTADEALIDQAEMMDGFQSTDIDTIVREMGSRFRGTVRGRPRLGQLTFLANSGDNPQLWDMYDQGAKEPNYVWSFSPSTWDNIYLTLADIKRYEKQAGTDDYQRAMYLKGERPIGQGEHFSQQTLLKTRDAGLDERMSLEIKLGTQGFVRLTADKVDVYKWEMPYDPTRSYVVAADAGWANPPNRNSAVVAVWDITDFPQAPAVLRAFSWVFGNNSPNPFVEQFTQYVVTYHAAISGFDATGPGAGYERMEGFQSLNATPVVMAGQKKYALLNLAKKFMADGLMRVPNIPHFFTQCSKYRLPDERIRQDIVMMLLVLAALLEEIWFDYLKEDVPEEEEWQEVDLEDRYDRSLVPREYADRYSERSER